MKDLILVTVNWNQQPCMELLLKSYVKHHYVGEPLRLMLIDNGSTDNSRRWLTENEISYFALPENVGHENALNVLYEHIDRYWLPHIGRYWLLNDTDVEYKDNVYGYLDKMNDHCISVGELIDKNFIGNDKVKDRISPWFWLFDVKKMHEAKVKYFRDPSVEDWSYDVGSWQWEQMKNLGYENYNLIRKPGNQDNDIVSMVYDKFDHIGKVSWNLQNHGDRYSEVMMRRDYVKDRLELYKDIDLKGKFVL